MCAPPSAPPDRTASALAAAAEDLAKELGTVDLGAQDVPISLPNPGTKPVAKVMTEEERELA